ncbi:MAG: hypothetical protein COY75_08810 [Nitrospirae bacterium CG_4_10_14_0_8_um_filter_41_23]|nr:hypothetical protein [Nitrospirota bacterium]OIP58831.1 MAG: hypothetical protein AUK38_07220 [Nitrospirae bacterium CG2_30_41_42]PIQ95110.1 MAG: hypothetical protein COV68_01210 [Nitrospirae bacterium CG11_big_fil_rev_8_21_14_0_20_41_14]PIV41218.1 MAG: hypothetical protein COS27_10385 [Nitrospirae bacterium CG02_land_8_20_14_3_00_41_53]PIW88219.1 MAG: hypothetical protein COZ94_00970 [Nitrospirae bacterium CG_4_8_14_3_um_filter_41_47]PIY86244.1 MAG: hypothetical protein COY75_08810 [Nitros
MAIFTSRWALVEGYWKLGKRIIAENDNFERYKIYGKKIVQGVAESLRVSERTLWYAIRFAETYPDIQKLPEGKNITWNKLITKYLPAQKENKLEIPLPEGSYEVIVIDPPWPYGTEYDKDARRVASPYPELSLEELARMKLPSADNCVLWLWTTHKFIWDAKRLMDLWGFEYKLILVWNKGKMGMGRWLRCQTEFALLGIKGQPKWNLTNERDIITSARQEHSTKPDAFYEMVKKLCPAKSRIDIFARKKRQGCDSYGNEI